MLKQHKFSFPVTILLTILVLSPSLNVYPQNASTNASLDIVGGNLTLYPGDKLNNNDICTNTDINTTVANPGFPVIKETITCNTDENSISLGSIYTAPTRQNPATIVDDVLFDDLRGQTISGYTITAEVSNFIDYNNAANIIILGTNPDNEPTALDTGKVTSIVVTNTGTGYNSAPNISFINGGGTGATATATVSGGVITRIDVKSYGTGYTTSPTVIISPTNGGTGATATANIIEAGSNLNPATSLPEANIFATMDPSVGTVYKLKPNQETNPTNFITGPRALITAPAIQHTLFATTTGVPTGRYDLDATIFALRAPAYLPTGDYRSVITQTIVVDSGVTNTAPVVTNGNRTAAPGSIMGFSQAGFNTQYSDAENDPMVSLKITSLPSQGTLKLNGANVSLNQVIPAAQLDNLTYETVNSTYNASFNFTANDGIDNSNVGVESLVIEFQSNNE